ncbi:uncharacterized protein HaLaN_23535, partial [Haematococcus lacustris]
VVLPDPKKAEDDLVLFLDEAYAAAELWEAEQRAAVTALQRVAGDRGYDSLLPKQFVGMWRELGEVHARRKAESEARAAAQKEAQQRMRAASQKSRQRAPQVLTMSREKQAAVQAVLRERLGLSGTPMAGPGAAGRQKSAAPSAPLEPDLEALVSQGFKRELVVWAREGAAAAGWGAVDAGQFAAASQGLHPTGSGAGGDGRYQAVLEWLLVACSPDQIPPRFTVGASNAVTRITPLSRGASSLNGPDDDAVAERFDPVTATALLASVHTEGKAKQVREDLRGQGRGERLALAQVQAVARLAAWGYDDELCEEALAQASQVGDEEAALCWLFDRLTGRNTATDCETPSAACSEAWAEEVMVLDAIFDDAVTSCEQGSHALQLGTNETHTASTSPWSGPQVVVRLPLPDPCPAAYQAWELQEGDAEGFKDTEAGVVDTRSATLTLLFRCVGASAPAYPDRAPLIAASCPSLRPKHLRRVTRALAAAAEKLLGQPMLHDLAMLAVESRGELLAALVQHGVLVISGATGCGKSTQVPQYILEEAVASGQGAAVNIIVTQPRRISALGLAQRVAQERGEEVGETVGYSVRLDSRTSPRTRLLFCTTGILLRRLLSQPLLDGVSHVVLDEVHERSIEIDLLLLLLRDVMLVLMSATADAQLFAQYMQRDPQPAPRTAAEKGGSRASTSQRGGLKAKDGVPLAAASGVATLTIPGFTYPVREMYLEDVLELTGHVDEEQINYEGLADLVAYIVQQQQQHGRKACMAGWQEGLAALEQVGAEVAAGGAVLVFLPGAPEISRAQRCLRSHSRLLAAAGGQERLQVLPLHGALSARDQSAVFVRYPAGTYKIVLATN